MPTVQSLVGSWKPVPVGYTNASVSGVINITTKHGKLLLNGSVKVREANGYPFQILTFKNTVIDPSKTSQPVLCDFEYHLYPKWIYGNTNADIRIKSGSHLIVMCSEDGGDADGSFMKNYPFDLKKQ